MEQTDQQLSITQTRTGYWSVQRGPVQLSGAMTRKGAEAERDLLHRLAHAQVRRSAGSAGIRTRRASRAGAFSG
jgi:hypothetical protein